MIFARPIAGAGVLALLLVFALGPTVASPVVAAEPDPAAPTASLDEAIALERAGFALEDSEPDKSIERYREAAERFETLAARAEGGAQPYWRGARCHWLTGELLPVEQSDARVASFTRSDAMASRGLEIDPECAECMLWKFAALGRLSTAQGVWQGARNVPVLAALLDRGIALQPTQADSERNSTLGNLYYSSAIFYRVLPDWFWLGWMLGVRGDKDRALRDIRSALAIHPNRLDYRIELGSQLLCQGATMSRRRKRLDEGRVVLEDVLRSEPDTRKERRELEAARVMLAAPARSCGYTGDTWLELDESKRPR